MDTKTIEKILSYLDSPEELAYWREMKNEISIRESVEQYAKHIDDIPSWITELKAKNEAH